MYTLNKRSKSMKDYVPRHKPDIASKIKIVPVILFCLFVYSGVSILGVVYFITTGTVTSALLTYGSVSTLVFAIAGAWLAKY
jgi:hypothetical protein